MKKVRLGFTLIMAIFIAAIALISDNTEAATGTWKKDKIGYWYSYPNGLYARNEWIKDKNRWYYLNEKGYMQTGWKKLSGKWYYFAGNGAMQTGWKKLSGKWYYFAGNGAMQTGWKKLSGKWYYFAGSGVMQTGWKKLSGEWYYFTELGEMVTGWIIIDKEQYYFDNDGVFREDITITCNHYWVDDEVWVPEVTEKVWVVDQEAYSYQEEIYKERDVCILLDNDGSSWYYYDDEIEIAKQLRKNGYTHYDNNGNMCGSYLSTTNYSDCVGTGEYQTVEVPEEGHWENRVISEGHFEAEYQICLDCGERRKKETAIEG